MSRTRVRVSCKNRTRKEILSEISRALSLASLPKGQSTWIILEDLALIRDSISRVLGELVRLAESHSAHLVVADASGLAQTFLEGIGGAEPFITFKGTRRSG